MSEAVRGAAQQMAYREPSASPRPSDILGHDLRSALATVVSATELLLRSRPDERQRLYAAAAQDAARTALVLLEDLPERGEEPGLSLRPEPVDLSAFLDRVEQSLCVQASIKGIAASVERARGLPSEVLVDPVRLGQLIENLVSNAVRVTDAGTVRIRVSFETPARSEPLLRFDVEDNGPGVPEELRDCLFEPRVQGDGGTRGRQGLGLWIARDLAQRMGGEIALDTAYQPGARFRVTVKVGLAATTLARPASQGSGPLAVLVADDAAINRALLSTLLEGFGMAAELVATGPEAMAALIRRPFDIVLLDVHMPEVDGFETLGRIRCLGERGRLPVVAVTARAEPGENERLLAAGFDAYVAKPIETRALYRTLVDLTWPASQAG